MGNLFNMDNVVWRTMGKMVDVCILTVLWFICCIPIFTIGPASTAVYYVTMKLVRDEESYTVRSFFKSFKENFKQGIGIGLIMTFLGIFFLYDIYAYFVMGTQIGTLLAVLFIGLMVVYLFTVTYVYALQAKFYNTVRNTIKNALFMSVKHFLRSIVMIVIFVAVWVGVLFFPPLLLLSYGLIAFLQSFFLVKIFDIYIPKDEDKPENEDLFMTNKEMRENQEREAAEAAQAEAEPEHIVITEEDVRNGGGFSRDMIQSARREAEQEVVAGTDQNDDVSAATEASDGAAEEKTDEVKKETEENE